MRDTDRIFEILLKVQHLWSENQDLRFMQILIKAVNPDNIEIPSSELYYLEDEVLLGLLNRLIVVSRATSIFEDRDKAITWLNSPCYALGNQIPNQLLNTSEGVKLVMDTLGRIKSGVFS